MFGVSVIYDMGYMFYLTDGCYILLFYLCNCNVSYNTENKMDYFHIQRKRNKKIIKLFKDTQIKIAFRTQNTMQNITKQHP
jgi:hypothetical protein